MELRIDVSAFEDSRSHEKKGDLTGIYYPRNSSRDDKNEKDNITTYIKTRVNEVATICNITLDWNKATWGWNYKD